MIKRALDRIGKVGAVYCGVCMLGISVTIGAGAISRYAFNKPFIWIEDVVGAFMVMTVFSPLLYILLVDRHITINLITKRLPQRPNKYLLLIACLLGLVYTIYLVVEGIRLAGTMIHYHSMYAMIRVPQVASEIFLPLGLGMLALGFLWLFAVQLRKLILESRQGKTKKDTQ